MADDVVVLVSLGPRNRTVSFTSDPSTAYENLKGGIRREFEDVLEPGQDFFLQKKSEEWGGVFIDLCPGTVIPDRSIIKAIIDRKEVGTMIFKHE